MGSGGVAIAALPTVICLKVPFSDGLGGRTKFEKEKTMPSATIGLTFLWGLTKKSVLPLLELTKKSIVS